MKKKLKLTILTMTSIMSLYSCKERDSTTYFSKLDNEYNILNIKKTNYYYNNNLIYSCGVPDSKYSLYGLSNFISIENGTLYKISIHRNCTNIYKDKQYTAYKLNEISEKTELDECNILVMPIGNFNQLVGDTVSRFFKEYHNNGDWIILSNKEYSNTIKDTVYEFNIHYGGTRNRNTIYYIAQQKGIVGMANLNWGVVVDSIGYPFIQQSIKIDLDTIDVSILKYIKNIEKG